MFMDASCTSGFSSRPVLERSTLSRITVLFAAITACVLGLPATASASFNSTSSGADGAFHPLTSVLIDLAQAGTGPGTGTYDPVRWAVIFNYTDIDVPEGVTVTFSGHPSGAPVVWLASGDVIIAGTVSANGTGGGTFGGAGGPGGFAGGGGGTARTRGFGPGGAGYPSSSGGSGGSYGTTGASTMGSQVYPTYGNQQILPLIGGSGGAPATGYTSQGGAGGGGALLIAASGTFTLATGGRITANGGAGGNDSYYKIGGGSGGAIRILATTFTGTGSIQALGGYSTYANAGGAGRIRVEAEDLELGATSTPAWTYDLAPGPVFQDTTTPDVRVTSIDGQVVTADPQGGFSTVDHEMSDSGPVEIGIEAHNIPVGTTVSVHMVRAGATETVVTSSPLSGLQSLSTATATVTFTALVNSEIYLKANW